jgi:ankyrin repeat protein
MRGIVDPLHSAASNGRNSIITFLVKQGADINAHDNHNNTPLHEAAWYSVNLVLRQGLVQDYIRNGVFIDRNGCRSY